MSPRVLRRPLPVVAALAVPAIAVLLAAGGIATTVVLQERSDANHDAQLRVATATALLDELQSAVWQRPATAAEDAALRDRLRSAEARLAGTASKLDAPGLPAALHRHFAALDAVAASGRRLRRAGPTELLAAGQARTLVAPREALQAAASSAQSAADSATDTAILGSVAAIVALLAAFGYFYVRSRRSADAQRRAHASLTVAHDKLARAQEERLHLLARTVEGAEDERRRIAADLHDGPIQRLTAAAFTLDLLASRIARGERDVLSLAEQVRDQLSKEMRALRKLMAELRPPVLDEGGVVAAIRESAAEVLSRETTCTVVDRTGAARFGPDVEAIVYRVAREALVNVRKHARATAVSVEIERAGELLWLTVADDGAGFDPGEVAARPPGRHFGLLAMRERVESVGGEMRVASAPDAGTRLEAILPWNPAGVAGAADGERRVAA